MPKSRIYQALDILEVITKKNEINASNGLFIASEINKMVDLVAQDDVAQNEADRILTMVGFALKTRQAQNPQVATSALAMRLTDIAHKNLFQKTAESALKLVKTVLGINPKAMAHDLGEKMDEIIHKAQSPDAYHVAATIRREFVPSAKARKPSAAPKF